jgi:hypothetical protein
MCARFAKEAGADAPCVSRRSPERRRSQVSVVRRECGARPQRGLSVRHRANQRADLRWHGRPSHAVSALPCPLLPEASPVPRDDGLRLDDDERRSPAGPGARESIGGRNINGCNKNELFSTHNSHGGCFPLTIDHIDHAPRHRAEALASWRASLDCDRLQNSGIRRRCCKQCGC